MVTSHVLLFVGTGLWGQVIVFVLLCNVFPCLSNDFFMIFNLLLVLILLCFIRPLFIFIFFSINTKEIFS